LVGTDPLTQLRNRVGFDKDLEQALKTDRGDARAVTLILLDLDDFKSINDRHGHAAGDAVLKRIGHRISCLPNLRSAARVGGDEFAVLVDSNQWEENVTEAQIEADISAAIEFVYRPIKYKNLVFSVSGSAGLSRFPIDAENLKELLRNASASLQSAKRSKRGSVSIYNSEIDEIVQRKRLIQASLLSGAFETEIDVAFQPICEPDHQSVRSIEALARWQHNTLGNLNPQEFLLIARDCGLIHEVERRLRSIALREMKPVLQASLTDSISFNFSPLELCMEGAAQAFMDQVTGFDICPRQVWIEVTETERLTSMVNAQKNLSLLHEAGVRFALDDYGVGFSNIRRLAELPIDRIKIDKSIVQNIDANKKYAGVFKSSLHLAKALGAEVVAEGVEKDRQFRIARKMGCRLMQGYLFFKPMLASELKTKLSQEVSRAA